jgi:hypothetical protein
VIEVPEGCLVTPNMLLALLVPTGMKPLLLSG